jgi:glycerol-3-phosphate dehydrogenase
MRDHASRQDQDHGMPMTYDLAIIGGGINGCGIARDAAGRGLSVHLSEMNDLASGTSSWSTKLIHGGLRYLEYYEFRLVREALVERERLWGIAPHIIRPLRFVLPHHKGLRPAWLLRLGLFLYDHIGGRKRLPATATLDLSTDVAGKPLKPGLFAKGFEYSDCWVDDARLVALNARDAAARGAVIRTRTKVISATHGTGLWQLTTQDMRTGQTGTVLARALVNAAGPWVAEVLNAALRSTAKAQVRQVQGSHIIVPRIFDHDRAYLFQNADGRIIFAIPYELEFTLIGTTDQDYHGDPAKVAITKGEIDYLCAAASEYFAKPVLPHQVVWTYSGVRPLYDDGASEAKAATRDYVFAMEAHDGAPPLLSIFGGKITTYRRLAEEALERLEPYLSHAGARKAGWTAQEPLPGGDFARGGTEDLGRELRSAHPFLSERDALRLARAYGNEARAILGRSATRTDLGIDFGGGLSEAEIRHMISHEWAIEADDVLWRRSKLGLHLNADQKKHVADFMRKMP